MSDELDRPVALRIDGLPVAWLNSGRALPAEHSPRPYVHPIHTLGGVQVTDLAPADHRWHAGLSLAVADVAGDNFWGGNSFVAGTGYVLLDDHGRMDLQRPPALRPDGRSARLDIVWRDRHGRPVIDERRTIEAATVSEPAAWRLTVLSELTNVAERVLEFGSPGTRGRPDAGYGGWTLRLAPPLCGAEVLTSRQPETAQGEAALGQAADWVCYRGAGVTVLLIADEQQPWYVRVDEFPAVGPAPFFRSVVPLAPGARMRLGLTMVAADGTHDPESLLAQTHGRCADA